MSRLPFAACGAFLALLWAGFVYARSLGLDPRWVWAVCPLLLFPTACIVSKRLHDLGRAGWWGFVIVWALVEWGMAIDAAPAPTTALGYGAGFVLILAEAYLVFVAGAPGANRFGANPAEARR